MVREGTRSQTGNSKPRVFETVDTQPTIKRTKPAGVRKTKAASTAKGPGGVAKKKVAPAKKTGSTVGKVKTTAAKVAKKVAGAPKAVKN